MIMFYFNHGEYSYIADDTGWVEWDGDGDDEPTDAEVEAAQTYWTEEGWDQALSDEQDEIGDHRYEMSRDCY